MIGDNIEAYLFTEPLGHDNPRTKIERYWDSFYGPFALTRSRTIEYALNSNMTFRPLQYSISRFHLDESLPDDAWIVDNFTSLVRTEFSSRDQTFPKDWPISIDKRIYVSDDFLEKIAYVSESYIYNRSPIHNDELRLTAESVYELLCNPKVGNKTNSSNIDKDRFVNNFISQIANNRRLLFVLPGFPFKDQNRFRVPFSGDCPDMAEICFMLRLFMLTQLLYQIDTFDADIVVLSDGDLYHDIFGIEHSEVASYNRKLEYYRNKLNIQACVSFISIKDMIDRANEGGTIDKILAHIKERLELIIASSDDLKTTFQILKQGMKWNFNSKLTSINTEDKICWDILCSSRDTVPIEHFMIWDDIESRASNAALQYAAINLMLKKTSLIQLYFPESIRATVHPKAEQVALAGNNSYAWNGVAWSQNWPENIDDFFIRPYMTLAAESIVNQVILESTGQPLFFTSGEYKVNIQNARKTFPLKEHSTFSMLIKPFNKKDADAFKKLGENDCNFNWFRINKDAAYYDYLLDFRIKHYEKFGFGVYGVWENNKLIGQIGLQVLDYELDQVEWVMFLGKDYTNKGIGSKLLKFIIDLSITNGLETLYAVVRPENNAGIAIAKKFGGIAVRKTIHYKEEGIVFKINLSKAV